MSVALEYIRQAVPLAEIDTTSERWGIQAPVLAEIKSLQEEGWNVQIVDVPDPHAPSEADRLQAKEEIASLEAMLPDEGYSAFRSEEDMPAMAVWARFLMKAVALEACYQGADAVTLGGNVTSDVFDLPLIFQDGAQDNALSAREVLVQEKIRKAALAGESVDERFIRREVNELLADYQQFFTTRVDSKSGRFYAGSADAEGIRTRAIAAEQLIIEHFTQHGYDRTQDLVSASWACGGAQPMAEVLDELGGLGVPFKRAVLTDIDPIALATGHSRMQTKNPHVELVALISDLVRTKPSAYLGLGTVALGDKIGLAEYLPDAMLRRLLTYDLEVMAPNSYFVLTNMLADRPEQTLFRDVVRWPRLYQRNIRQVLDCMVKAGGSKDTIQVRVPTTGVYASYGMHCHPTGNNSNVYYMPGRHRRTQRQLLTIGNTATGVAA